VGAGELGRIEDPLVDPTLSSDMSTASTRIAE